jgi:hypothetical protein
MSDTLENNNIEFTVDPDSYYTDFVKTTNMSHEDALTELKQNIKRKDNGCDIDYDINFLNTEFNKVKIKQESIKPKSSEKKLSIEPYSYITIEDNSDKPMTKDNGKNTMKSLFRTTKGNSMGCFNFGEILAMSVLVGHGRVIYYNKQSKESWCIVFDKNKKPVFNILINDNDNLILNTILKTYINNSNGTLKIIITNDDDIITELKTDIFIHSCDYINTYINDFKFLKFTKNSYINDVIQHKKYIYKTKFEIYIDVEKDGNNEYQVNLIYGANSKYEEYKNVSKTKSKKKNDISKDTYINKNNKITIETCILPYDYLESPEIIKDIKEYPNLIYNFNGFNLPIKKKDKINKLIYPNIGGNICLQNSFTNITVSILENELDINLFIKKNILGFYPDKLKSGEPLIDWKYLRIITKKLEDHYNYISHNNRKYPNIFEVRNRYFPSIENKIYDKKDGKFINTELEAVSSGSCGDSGSGSGSGGGGASVGTTGGSGGRGSDSIGTTGDSGGGSTTGASGSGSGGATGGSGSVSTLGGTSMSGATGGGGGGSVSTLGGTSMSGATDGEKKVIKIQRVIKESKLELYIPWKSIGYFGIKNCSKERGILTTDNYFECKFGVTDNDPKHRDTGSGLGTDWRRYFTININKEGSKKIDGGKWVIENELYKNLNNFKSVQWKPDSTEYFSVKQNDFKAIYSKVREIMSQFEDDY